MHPKIRTRIRDRTHAATCLGFEPRFQHSTGQAYKGGTNSGVFLQITCDDPGDIDVPGHAYSFGVVQEAQAKWKPFDVLIECARRATRPPQGRRCGIGGAHALSRPSPRIAGFL
jgi:transaldolase / glucose-6-phosphate isomerase